MLQQGAFIARIPNDEHAQSKIDEFKRLHGQLRLCGRHKDRVGQLKAIGRNPNSHHDLPWRLGTEIVIYRAESGMTFQQFKSLQIGDLVSPSHPLSRQRHGHVGVVVEKKHKDKLRVAFSGVTQWASRQQMILLQEQA